MPTLFTGLTQDQISFLRTQLAIADTPPTGSKTLFRLYEEIRRMLSGIDGEKQSKKDGVDGSVWEFVNAAANINKDGNDMSTVTRVYSKTQAELRLGSTTDLAVQQASDDIARAVIEAVIKTASGFLDGTNDIPNQMLPTIQDIAQNDAPNAAKDLFKGDKGGWVGSPMFIFFADNNSGQLELNQPHFNARTRASPGSRRPPRV
jgi:hypothetical protein